MPPTASLPAHAPKIHPGAAPGSQFVRLITDKAHVISEHPLPEGDEAQAEAARKDQQLAFQVLREEPETVLYTLVYDGDSGECVDIHILAASDVRAHDKGTEPAE